MTDSIMTHVKMKKESIMKEIYEKGFKTDPNFKIHGMIYIMNSASFTIDGNLIGKDEIQEFITFATSDGITPVVVVTHGKSVPISKDLFITNKIGYFTTDEVYFIENYTTKVNESTIKRDWNVDWVVCDYLESIITKAKEVDKHHYKKLIKDLNNQFSQRFEIKNIYKRLKKKEEKKNLDLSAKCEEIENFVEDKMEGVQNPKEFLNFFERYSNELKKECLNILAVNKVFILLDPIHFHPLLPNQKNYCCYLHKDLKYTLHHLHLMF